MFFQTATIDIKMNGSDCDVENLLFDPPVSCWYWKSVPPLCTSACPPLLPVHTYWLPVRTACTATTHSSVPTTPVRGEIWISPSLPFILVTVSDLDYTGSLYLFTDVLMRKLWIHMWPTQKQLQCFCFYLLGRSKEMEITFPIYKKEDKDHDYHMVDGLSFLNDDIVGKCTTIPL